MGVVQNSVNRINNAIGGGSQLMGGQTGQSPGMANSMQTMMMGSQMTQINGLNPTNNQMAQQANQRANQINQDRIEQSNIANNWMARLRAKQNPYNFGYTGGPNNG